MPTASGRSEWLASLSVPLRRLLAEAENHVTFVTVGPPTERAFSDALHAIRAARSAIREERRQARAASRS
jgi:hypothetical protein